MSTRATSDPTSPAPAETRATRRPGRRRRVRWLPILAVLALAAALVAGYFVSRQAAVPTIQVAKAAVTDLAVTVSAPGTVEAGTTTNVYAPAAGTLASVAVTDGQAVEKGATLATLDSTATKAAVTQAETALAQAKAQVSAADAAAAQASAQRSAADAMPDDTDAQTKARTAARKAADAAAESASAAKDAARAGVDAARATLERARADLAKSTITAPVAGTVSLPVIALTSLDGGGAKAAAGASVTTVTPVFTITDPASAEFVAQVDEADVAGVKAGQQASVTLDAYPGRTFAGTVKTIATTATATKTGGVAYLVHVPLPSSSGVTLRFGMSGDASLATQNVGKALTVPAQAVVTDAGKRYVYKVSGDTVAKTEVAVGASTEAQAQITSGLAEGDAIAITQLTALSDGAKVHVA